MVVNIADWEGDARGNRGFYLLFYPLIAWD
jgi:hypothetical protein